MNVQLSFEGEYLDGKQSEGKVYDTEGNIIDEIKNINGKGKEYDSHGELIFEGEYLNGKRNGKGKEYYKEKIKFEGEYLNGKEWEGNGYDKFNNIAYKLKGGKGLKKEYGWDGELIFEGNI